MYSRAYTALTDYLIAFGVGTFRPEDDSGSRFGARATSSVGFSSEYQGNVQVGDLVRLGAMRDPEYRLGWLLETRELNPGYVEYLIRSAKTGNECWWGNVGISYLHRTTLESFPNWKWTDAQYAFSDMWDLACAPDDPYIFLPYMGEFVGNDATLMMRMRFGLDDDKRQAVVVKDWAKLMTKPKGYVRKKLLMIYRKMIVDAKAQRNPEQKP